MTKGLDRKTQAMCALHDYATRANATASKVKKQMKDAGFSLEEIQEAAKEYFK